MQNEDAENDEGKREKANAPANGGGGFKSWLPLITALVVMPLASYFTITLVLAPRLESSPSQAREQKAGNQNVAGHEESSENASAGIKSKRQVKIDDVLVNVAGSMGTRYLMTSFTIVGYIPDFKTRVEENKAQLLDVALGALGTKTIADLEKPGARNLIRSELISLFNGVLGADTVSELYFTEFAIQ
ncbi:MAG: flagellar basal body-associated FliL family protein [Verrucomicrobia bacterium]|nr:flagellar basal body-associated FliL family protein [Verrucomicrobiota bacterium]MCF7707903.1 flagellar basal body-associated FliL family protein [Verrucomicrobiota bacterium]